MTDQQLRTRLEQLSGRVQMNPDAFDQLCRRRARVKRMRKFSAIGVAVILATVGTLGLVTALRVNETATPSGSPSYQVGIDTVPHDAMRMAIALLNGQWCYKGSLSKVDLAGATTVGDLAQLQPDTPALSEIQEHSAADANIFAVVLSGDCSRTDEGHTYVFRQAYLLFMEDGRVPFMKGFHPGYEVAFSEPFGDAVNEAIKG